MREQLDVGDTAVGQGRADNGHLCPRTQILVPALGSTSDSMGRDFLLEMLEGKESFTCESGIGGGLGTCRRGQVGQNHLDFSV